MAANHTAAELRSFTWGFDPHKLLQTVEFPYDLYEALLRRDRGARKRALRSEVVPLDHNGVRHQPVDAQFQADLAREAAAIAIQSMWKGHITRRKYTLVRFGDMTAKTYGTPSSLGTTSAAASRPRTVGSASRSQLSLDEDASVAETRPQSIQSGIGSGRGSGSGSAAGDRSDSARASLPQSAKSKAEGHQSALPHSRSQKTPSSKASRPQTRQPDDTTDFSTQFLDDAPSKSLDAGLVAAARKHDAKSKIMRDFANEDITEEMIERQDKWHSKYQAYAKCRQSPLNYDDFCATKIQTAWKGFLARRALKKTLALLAAATTPTEREKALGWLVAEQKKQEFAFLRKDQDRAATVAQRAWRRYWKRKIFGFYRDLIKMRESRDPRATLKLINPQEAQLIDAAAGLHVRFRLGGEHFPPTIYYKIYVHNNMIDLNAFAPRDYHQAQGKKQSVYEKFNKVSNVAASEKDTKQGWYMRFENNGWRPIIQSCDPFELLQDPVYVKSTFKRTAFHHIKVKRREDVVKLQRQRKVEWMKKMYSERKGDGQQPDGAAVDAPPLPLLDEQDMLGDDLLDWSGQLDFEQYCQDWLGLATSIGAQAELAGQDAAEAHLDSAPPDHDDNDFGAEFDKVSTYAASRAASARSTKSVAMDLSDLFLSRDPQRGGVHV
ncbi:hypothetical protein RI367_003048 [Sorochytrium milnesiophthora]